MIWLVAANNRRLRISSGFHPRFFGALFKKKFNPMRRAGILRGLNQRRPARRVCRRESPGRCPWIFPADRPSSIFRRRFSVRARNFQTAPRSRSRGGWPCSAGRQNRRRPTRFARRPAANPRRPRQSRRCCRSIPPATAGNAARKFPESQSRPAPNW